MIVIAVDDERFALENLVESINQASSNAKIHRFRYPEDALDFAKENRVDVAFLDVEMVGMSPFLKHEQDVVYLRAWEEKDLRCGQILLFQRPDDSLVLHRVRKRFPDGKLLMNGDAQVWCETISPEQVVGVVSSVERKGRHISCDSIWFWLWNWIWYPTRPIRPVLFKLRRILFS